ncbi:MAG: hypothetical protein U1E99_05900 [Agitococcus sp.]
MVKAGDDTLHGGEGNDTLVGGIGNDTISNTSGYDVVAGSSSESDTIGVSGIYAGGAIDGGMGGDSLAVDWSMSAIAYGVQKNNGEWAYFGQEGNTRLSTGCAVGRISGEFSALWLFELWRVLRQRYMVGCRKYHTAR